MRKSAALVVMLLALSFGTSRADVEIGIGAKGGVNLAELTGDVPDGRSTSNKPGTILGMVAHFSFGSIFSLQTELNYSARGTEWDYQQSITDSSWIEAGLLDSLGLYDVQQKVNLTYLEIPILAMLKLPTGSRWVPYAYAGPTLGFNITAGTNIDAGLAGGSGVTPFLQGRVSNASGFDFSGAVGAGVGYKLADLFATIDVRYSKSFSGVFDDADPSFIVIDDFPIVNAEFPIVDPATGQAYDLKNQAWTITISAVGIL